MTFLFMITEKLYKPKRGALYCSTASSLGRFFLGADGGSLELPLLLQIHVL